MRRRRDPLSCYLSLLLVALLVALALLSASARALQ